MTEKRFRVINISKNGMKGLFQVGNDNLSVYDVARLLNELWEENEQLKSFNQDLSENLSVCADKRLVQGEYLTELTNENNELKQQREKLFIRERDCMNKCRNLKQQNKNVLKILNYLFNENKRLKRENAELIAEKILWCDK